MESNGNALYLIPSPLGESGIEHVIPEYNRQVVRSIRCFAAESLRSAIRTLKAFDSAIDIDSLKIYELSEHTSEQDIAACFAPILSARESVGLISDAGCPCVADPGAPLVRLAHKLGVRVVPLVGPSSVILSLMASGFNGQSFAFNGYLPVRDGERAAAIRRMETLARSRRQTQIFIETPYRNLKLLKAVLDACRAETLLCVASNLTTKDEFIKTLPVSKWRENPPPDIDKAPAVFLLYAGSAAVHPRGRAPHPAPRGRAPRSAPKD